MSWVYYADRKPTEADADANGHLILLFDKPHKRVELFHYTNIEGLHSSPIAWMTCPPLPPRKIWRTPTQADLDKAKEPIPCRVRDEHGAWNNDRLLVAIDVYGRYIAQRNETHQMYFWTFCEIEVDA